MPPKLTPIPGVTARANRTYLVRWYDAPGTPQKSKQFPAGTAGLRAANAFRTRIDHDKNIGIHQPLDLGRITLADYVVEYQSRRRLAPNTESNKERDLRLHILPALGSYQLVQLKSPRIEQWAHELDLKPSTVKTVFNALRAVLTTAVNDGRILRNPCTGVVLPRDYKEPFVLLEPAQIHAVADEVRLERPDLYAAVILTAGTGLRQGELFGLTKGNVDTLRRELHVRQQLITVDGPPALAPLKTSGNRKNNSLRTVSITTEQVDLLAAHLAEFGTGADDVVFHTDGAYVGRSVASKIIGRARVRLGMSGKVGWHSFRHYHASVLLSHGVSVKAVAQRIGDDAKTVMDTYAHVMPRDDDLIRAVVTASLTVDAASANDRSGTESRR